MLAQSIKYLSSAHGTPVSNSLLNDFEAQVCYPSIISHEVLAKCGYVKFTGSFPTSAVRALTGNTVFLA